MRRRSGSSASRHLGLPHAGRRRQAPNAAARQILGLAWYDSSQWPRLLKMAADRDALEETWEEWRQSASNMMVTLGAQGVVVRPVAIDVDEVVEWCRAQGRPFDGASRSAFTAECMRNGTARYLDEDSGGNDVRSVSSFSPR